VAQPYAYLLRNIGERLYRLDIRYASIGSVPCIAARIVLDGHFSLAALTDEAVRQPSMLRVADRITVDADEPVARPPDRFSADARHPEHPARGRLPVRSRFRPATRGA